MKGKRHLKHCGIFLLVLSILFLPACKGQATEEPRLKVTAGEQELRVIYYGNQSNETREEINKRLKMAMEETSVEELPYVPLDSVITLEAENFRTEEFSLSDNILNDNGEIFYREDTALTSVVPVKDGMAELSLPVHPVVFLSSVHPASPQTSDGENGEPEGTIRGIVVRADIDGTSFAFAFILRTDAGTLKGPQQEQ